VEDVWRRAVKGNAASAYLGALLKSS